MCLCLMFSSVLMSYDMTCTIKNKQKKIQIKFSVNKIQFIIYRLRLAVKTYKHVKQILK